MLSGEKILITGPAGQIAYPIAAALAKDNEVWGIARFSDPASRERVAALGVTTRSVDLASGDFSDLPDDFTYLLHTAAYLGGGLDYDLALATNAEGTGLLMRHCASAKAALIMSTMSVYKAHEDPWHPYVETDPLGDAHLPVIPTYSVSKIGLEAVARTFARALGLPTVITRINAVYGPNGGLLVHYLDQIVDRQPVTLRWDPSPYTPIYESDVVDQVEAMLAAASVPATIVNWGGDEAVPMQDVCRHIGELTGRPVDLRVAAVPGTQRGAISDVTRRRSITGPCRVPWREGIRRVLEHRYPQGVDGPRLAAHAAARAMTAQGQQAG
ncbi:MAG: NAD(P)-dependent oxidoreductase [Frankia sp.]|nr:NAD(P)-dependent oxidoreductase [Frankia sp.]